MWFALRWERQGSCGGEGRKGTRTCDTGFRVCSTDAGALTDTRRSLIASRMSLSFRYDFLLSDVDFDLHQHSSCDTIKQDASSNNMSNSAT